MLDPKGSEAQLARVGQAGRRIVELLRAGTTRLSLSSQLWRAPGGERRAAAGGALHGAGPEFRDLVQRFD